jgi:hypothetical protein
LSDYQNFSNASARNKILVVSLQNEVKCEVQMMFKRH